MKEKIKELYKNYPEIPYISENRDLETFLKNPKLVPKRNMIRTEDNLLAGHIILLWRVNFGTYNNEVAVSKYFEYDYGIDAIKEIEYLVEKELVIKNTALESKVHLSATFLKNLLKNKDIKGLNKLKREEIDILIDSYYSEDEISKIYSLRKYTITEKGKKILEKNQEIVDKHPKKKV